jgi:hypothetical protein
MQAVTTIGLDKDRDLIRGEHYGQRSCEPHKKAPARTNVGRSAPREGGWRRLACRAI